MRTVDSATSWRRSRCWHGVRGATDPSIALVRFAGASLVTPDTVVVAAPEALNAQSRVDFRSAALECLERAVGSGSAALTIDMSATCDVDACGLGTLVMLTRRARERGLVTRLWRAQDEVRSLLSITHLEPLFQFRTE